MALDNGRRTSTLGREASVQENLDMTMGEMNKAVVSIGELVRGQNFKTIIDDFTKKYCNEFPPDKAENTIVHLKIFEEYVELIEREIKQNLKRKKLSLKALEYTFLNNAEYSRYVMTNNPDVIAQLTDYMEFSVFNALMEELCKQELDGEAQHRMRKPGDLPTNIKDDLSLVTQAVEEGMNCGWVELVTEFAETIPTKDEAPVFRVDIKDQRLDSSKPSMIRTTFRLDLSPRCAAIMMMNMNVAALHPTSATSDNPVIKDYGPWDKIFDMFLKMPLDEKMRLGYPESVPWRITVVENWPKPGDYGYRMAPFDLSRNVPMRENNPMKARSGVILRNSKDPSKCTIVSVDDAHLGDANRKVVGAILSSCCKSIMLDMVAKFREMSVYKDWQPLDESHAQWAKEECDPKKLENEKKAQKAEPKKQATKRASIVKPAEEKSKPVAEPKKPVAKEPKAPPAKAPASGAQEKKSPAGKSPSPASPAPPPQQASKRNSVVQAEPPTSSSSQKRGSFIKIPAKSPSPGMPSPKQAAVK